MQRLGRIDAGGSTRRGSRHETNHDHFAIATLNKSMRLHHTNLGIDDESRVNGHSQGHLFVVADGVGGGPAPARASGEAIDSLVRFFLDEMPWHHLTEGHPDQVMRLLGDALEKAQAELRRSAKARDLGMGTTMTMALVFWPRLYVAHVGDSRCYLHRDGALRQLTQDHTLAEIRRSIGSPGQGSQILWNAIGGHSDHVDPEVHSFELRAGDAIALVTDGLLDACGQDELAVLLDSGESCERTCERVVEKDGQDDRTIVLARFLPHEDELAAANADDPAPELGRRRGLPESSKRRPDEERERRRATAEARAEERPVPRRPRRSHAG